MRKRKLLIIVILMAVLIHGCKRDTDTVNSGAFKEEGLFGSNMGIINDTVADIFEDHEVLSPRVSQALFSQPVEIIETYEMWSRVKTVDESIGWVKSRYIDPDCSSIIGDNFKFKIVVTSKTMCVYSQPRGGTTLKEIVMGTELYSRYKTDGSYSVALPNGVTGWIQESGTIKISLDSKIPESTAADFAATAEKFKGVPYMQGGVSAFGIDFEGLIYICGMVNGKGLTRIGKQQVAAGKDIDFSGITTGDIIFFHARGNKDVIDDIGIFIGNSRFIHASRIKGHVVESSIEDENYRNRIANIRRIF